MFLSQFEHNFDSGGDWLPNSQTFCKTYSQALQIVALSKLFSVYDLALPDFVVVSL
jgi:hypothetical protein